MPPSKRRCQICGSTKLYKSVGGMVCDQGHVMAGYIREDNEMEGASRHAMRLRQLHKERKPRKKKIKSRSKAFVGIEADFLYWQCMQLILRKQIAALQKLWILPPEFEIICRDLWLLNLSTLDRPPPSEPWKRVVLGEHLDGGFGDGKDPIAKSISGQHVDAGTRSAKDVSTTDRPESGSDSEEEESDSRRAEIENLLRELSDPESEHSGISQQQEAEVQKVGRRKRITISEPLKPNESPMVNIAILYVACCVMRIPVICTDFIKLINSYRVPYLDPTLWLPTDVVTYLNTAKRTALKREFAPSTEELYDVSKTLAKMSRHLHDLPFPDFNVAPLLWRAVRGMLGSPILYVLVKGLIETLGLELSFYASRQVSRCAPEVTFVGATVSALKIVYGFDGRLRIAGDDDDPSLAMPSFEAYVTSLQRHWDARLDTEDELYSPTTTVPVTDLSDEQLDKYIAFSSRALLPGTDGSTGSERRMNGTAHRVAHLYPIPSIPDIEDRGTLRPQPSPEQPSPILMRLSDADHPPGLASQPRIQPGESIPIYDKNDFTGAFPHVYELVLNVAARWVGVSAEDVAQVVTGFDRALVGKSRADIFTKHTARKKASAEDVSELGGVGENGEGEQDDGESDYD